MAETSPDDSARVPLQDLLRTAGTAAAVGGVFYLVMSGVFQSESLQGLSYGGVTPAVLAIAAGLSMFGYEYHDLREKARARGFTARIDEELKKSAGEGGSDSVAAVSVSDVAAKVTENPAEAKKAEEYVEQRKQRLLVDKKTLSAELAYLVDNWQPLPRDVKRAVNRFCVTYLVAYNRGLLKDPPVVTGFQLAKWLALSERWPQLGRALAMAPDAIERLEDYAVAAVRGQPNGFSGLVAALAPQHADDEELREFIAKEPQLSLVLPRLVQYGMAQPAPETAVTVQQTPRVPEADATSAPAKHA